MEAAPRLDGCAYHDELRAALRGDACNLLAEAAGPCANDLLPDVDAVRAGDRGRELQAFLEVPELPVEMRVQRQLALEDGGRDEDDPSTPVGREPAGEVECMLGLRPVEQRHDDCAVGDRAGPAREAAGAVVEQSYVREPHRMRWYGTEARITFGSTSSSRFT